MKLGVAFREILPEPVVLELDRAYSRIRTTWDAQHDPDGGHANVTATRVDSVAGYLERGRSVFLGDRIDVAFDATMFSGLGAMTWGVSAGNLTTLAYTLIGSTLIYWFEIESTTVGGVPDTFLTLKLPNGFYARRTVENGIRVSDNGVFSFGFAQAVAEQQTVRLYRNAGGTGTWAASANNSAVYGMIAVEVYTA